MEKKHLAVLLASLALFCFLAAIAVPNFVSSQFVLPNNPTLTSVSKDIDAPCDLLCSSAQNVVVDFDTSDIPLPGFIVKTIKASIAEHFEPYCQRLCDSQFAGSIEKARDVFLDHTLGPLDGGTEKVSWGTCLDNPKPDDKASVFEGCLESWLVQTGGIPEGPRSFSNIIGGLIDSHGGIGWLMLIFTAVFPLIRSVLSIVVFMDNSKVLKKIHKYVTKFSMTEVLMVAMLITFIKAESFSFYMSFEVGSFLFICGSILIWISDVVSKSIVAKEER